jgi:hypothetical protein
MKAYFDKKRHEGKRYTSTLVAIERKLVDLVYAAWTRGTPHSAHGIGVAIVILDKKCASVDLAPL